VTGSNAGGQATEPGTEVSALSLFDVLRVGASVTGLAGPDPVKIVAVERLMDNSANVAYRTEAGIVEKIVFGDAVARIRAVQPGLAFSFDAEPGAFLLAAEARRMRLAHLFDPLAALGTSDLQPLPHQLRAVYGTMLVKQPLRFVLADDPGAGKTVMAGLLIKELLLRGDAANVMVISPGSLTDQWDEEMREKFGLEFEMLTRDKVLHEGNPFARGGLWPARLDVLSRKQRRHPRQGLRCRLGPHHLRRSPQDVRVRLGQRGQEDQALPNGRRDRKAHTQPPTDDGNPALG